MAYFEYKNHVNGVPEWVTNGGSFYNPANHTYITYIPDDRQYWIPDTLTELTKDEVEQRALDIHAVNPFMMIDCPSGDCQPRAMVEDEVVAWVLNYFNDMES